MTKIDLNYNLEDLDGKPVEGENYHIGRTLANVLCGLDKSQGSAIKLDDWARTLWKKQPIEVDATDKDFLSAFVETSEHLSRRQKSMILRTVKASEGKEKK